MNGIEFACASTQEGVSKVLVHAAPARAIVEVRDDEGCLLRRGRAERAGERTPMTLLELPDREEGVRRAEIWPDAGCNGLPVLLCGGEVGVLREWEHAEDHSWWRWTLELSNHV
jgi:hypothetical protein